MLIKIYPDNPNEKVIQQVVDVLKKGGIIIYPTDTIYGMGCDISNSKAIEKICKSPTNPGTQILDFLRDLWRDFLQDFYGIFQEISRESP